MRIFEGGGGWWEGFLGGGVCWGVIGMYAYVRIDARLFCGMSVRSS